MISIKHLLMAVAFAAAAVFGTASVGTSAFASDAQATKVADLEFQVQYRGDNRVCCKRGYRDWWSTYRQCRRSGGYVTANRACRDGRIGFNNARVCCKRGYRDWWSTARQCRRSGGYIVANRACRNG
jgi:hypothetical protein